MTWVTQTRRHNDSRLTRRRALAGFGAGGLGLVLASGKSLALAQEATPAMPGTLPPVVRAWADAWNAADRDALLALYSDDADYEEVPFGEGVRGREAIGAAFDQEFAAFSDIVVTVTNAFQAGNMAAAEGTFAATYANQAEGLPPATGQPFSVRVAAIFELEGDRIKRESQYFDAYGLLVQLGALPAPGGEAAAEATPT